jgi:3-deoxy-manno-octulosonate cytidylyltransferase (CMP-KDO synthetase)
MIIIPARVASTRFPNKVLAKIGDTPMVIKTAQAVSTVDEVVIATDSKKVVEVAENYNFKAVLTSSKHKSGTDRVFEATKILKLPDNEIVVNVQADEPFIEQEVVKKVFETAKKYRDRDRDEVLASSAYKIVSEDEANDPNIVKVVIDSKNMALYFSRAKIPHLRDKNLQKYNYKGHIGIYGYTVNSLKLYCSFSSSDLESVEKLEQLRILENGYKIAMAEVKTESFGIDTPEDLERALKLYLYI